MADVYIQMGGAAHPDDAAVPAAAGAAASLPPPPKGGSDDGDFKKAHKNRGIREQCRAFHTMAMPYFHESCAGRWLFVIMVLLTLLNSGVRVVFSYLMRDFWSALSDKRVEEFYTIMLQFMVALLILAPINVLYRFQRQRLAIQWREWMTDRVLQLYASNRVYYGLERFSKKGEIDNPDQRISEDVRSFTEFSLTLFLTVLMSCIDLVCFSVILFSIMPELFLAIALFAAFGTLMTVLIGKVLIRLNFEKLQKEADFRYSLVRIRENAESIAFYAGEDIEGKEVSHRFGRVIENMNFINTAQRNLDFFTTYYNYLTWVLPVAVVAPEYFAGNVELGVVTQASAAFAHVLEDLSIIVNQFESLSEFIAGIDRLFSFMNAIKTLDPDRPEDSPLMALPEQQQVWHPRKADFSVDGETIDLKQLSPISDSVPSENNNGAALTLSNLCLVTPNEHKRVLIQNLDLSLSWRENLLIAGASGAGKSSLLRAIAGLWTAGSGSIVRPSDQDVYFLPQRPYCALGSLRDQLLYPSTEDMNPKDYPEGHRLSRTHVLRQSLQDEDLLEILRAVDLAELPRRTGSGDAGLDAVLDWSNTLSLGEQQRLAFGRILVNKPRLVVMDESTSALDVESESRMYTLLKDLARRNGASSPAALTYVSVGHRPTLLAHHDTKLLLKGERHSVEPIRLSSEVTPDAQSSFLS